MARTRQFILGIGTGLTLAIGATSAHATVQFPYDPDGLGPLVSDPVPPQDTFLNGLNWAVGNALSRFDRNLDPASGGAPKVGDLLTTYYQAKLSEFSDNINGNVKQFTNGAGTIEGNLNVLPGFRPNGLPNAAATENFEWTAVARFREVVTAVDAGTGEISLALVDDRSNYFKIFYDGPSAAINGGAVGSRANDLAGTGFEDGVLVMTAGGLGAGGTGGNFKPSGNVGIFDTYLGTSDPGPILGLPQVSTPWQAAGVPYLTAEGTGRFNVDAPITFVNTDFMAMPPAPNNSLRFTMFTTTQQLPFDNVDPSVQFFDMDLGFIKGDHHTGGGPFNYFLGDVNGGLFSQGDNAIQFQADGNEAFDFIQTNIPEPATAAMGLMGLLGLALSGRRSRKA